MASFLSEEEISRIDLPSGEDIEVTSRAAFLLSLILNELGTNALKHGALRAQNGRISFSWTLGDVVTLVWKESLSGQDIPTTGHGSGFGSKLLASIVPKSFRGAATSDFSPDGLTYTLTAERSLFVYDPASIKS